MVKQGKPGYQQVVFLTEKQGYFENGKWVEEQVKSAPAQSAQPAFEARIADVTKNVASSIDNAVKVGRDLFETEEGRKYVEKSVRDAGSGLQKALEDILKKAQTEMEKTTGKK